MTLAEIAERLELMTAALERAMTRADGDLTVGPLPLADGRACWVEPLLGERGRLHVGRPGADGTPEDGGYHDTWDYPSVRAALAGWFNWDAATEAEPPGWTRHPGTGRRRPDGDAAREWVLR